MICRMWSKLTVKTDLILRAHDRAFFEALFWKNFFAKSLRQRLWERGLMFQCLTLSTFNLLFECFYCLFWACVQFLNLFTNDIWDKLFKNGSSKKFLRLSSTNFTWSIFEYFVPYILWTLVCILMLWQYCQYSLPHIY